MDKALEKPAVQKTERVENKTQDELEVGQWYWVRGIPESYHGSEDWLGCITHLGTNYANVTSVGNWSTRIHFKEWEKRIREREWNPEGVIDRSVQHHRQLVSGLMDDVKLLTAHLGLTPIGALPGAGGQPTAQALAVAHGVADVKAHKEALIKAKEKTLPELFKKIEQESEEMVMWMKARLIPMNADVQGIKGQTTSINDKIFVVELYAGLIEELTCIKDGEPASNDEKVHLFQRLHYMDEECLVNYEAGGMEFKDIRAFDKWLVRKGNGTRLLPMPKCAVAFRVRRKTKQRDIGSFSDWIRFHEMEEMDKYTFLYIRNGDRYYRLACEIDFGESLFPDEEYSLIRNHQLYTSSSGGRVISQQEYNDKQARHEAEVAKYEEDQKIWAKMTAEEKKHKASPWLSHSDGDSWIPVSPETVYYDDAMEEVAEQTKQYNRIAVILQGLLDRSPAFHPHPPWRLWTAEGFTSGVELHFDGSRGLTVGDPPDFEAFRSQLNQYIVVGTFTTGQDDAWLLAEAQKENARQRNDYRLRDHFQHTRFKPYGNPGPGRVARVLKLSRDKSQCEFHWERDRTGYRTKWVDDPERPGYLMPDRSRLPVVFRCHRAVLLNVDAYQPGDFKQFYNDPRTRADYLKWAPLLLAAEDFYGAKEKK